MEVKKTSLKISPEVKENKNWLQRQVLLLRFKQLTRKKVK